MRRRSLHCAISSLLLLLLAVVSKQSCLAFQASRTGNPSNRSRDGIVKGRVGFDGTMASRTSPSSSASVPPSSLAFSAPVCSGNARSARLNRTPQNRAPKTTLPPSLSSSEIAAAATAMEGAAEANMDGGEGAIDSCLESALRFARTNPNAVVLSLWPSAIGRDERTPRQVEVARSYLRRSGAEILFESALEIPDSASTLLVMAMYWGEDWLQTNCWYGEQPLEELGIGLARPTGPWPGATWKKELCFRQGTSGGTDAGGADLTTRRMHVFVADAGDVNRRLWSEKYAMRVRMSQDTGHAGNSCMHLTDDQSGMVAAAGGGAAYGGGVGMDCNASYAFACARCLLNPEAMKFLVHCATVRFVGDDALRGEEFETAFGKFCKWLGDKNFEDVVASPSSEGAVSKRWNRPPIW